MIELRCDCTIGKKGKLLGLVDKKALLGEVEIVCDRCKKKRKFSNGQIVESESETE